MDTILLVTMETAVFPVPACFQIREQPPLHTSGFYLRNGSLFQNESLNERKMVWIGTKLLWKSRLQTNISKQLHRCHQVLQMVATAPDLADEGYQADFNNPQVNPYTENRNPTHETRQQLIEIKELKNRQTRIINHTHMKWMTNQSSQNHHDNKHNLRKQCDLVQTVWDFVMKLR